MEKVLGGIFSPAFAKCQTSKMLPTEVNCLNQRNNTLLIFICYQDKMVEQLREVVKNQNGFFRVAKLRFVAQLNNPLAEIDQQARRRNGRVQVALKHFSHV